MGMKGFMDRLQQAINGLSGVGEKLSAVAICALAVVVTWGVVLTYVFNARDIFSVEVSTYLLVLICFASVAFVAREDRHVIVDAFVQPLPSKTRLRLKLLASVLTLVFCIILTWKALSVGLLNYQRGFRSASLVSLPLWIPYLIIALGALAMTLQYVAIIWDVISGSKALGKPKGGAEI